MRFRTSNCIALGVSDRAAAVKLYTETLGFKATGEGRNWTEIDSGALQLYLVSDEDTVPCFDMIVEDIEQAKAYLESAGFRQVDLAPGETFMQDPFGYNFCLSIERSEP